MKFLFLIICLLALSSCSTWSTGDRENLLGYYPPAASKIILHKPLKVRADRAGLYIQDGQNKGGAHSRFEPFCYIRFVNVKQAPRVIQPDIFYVSSSHLEARLVASRNQFQTPYRTISYRLIDDTPSDIVEVVTMRIVSAKQPSVYLLECGGVENAPAELEPPTITDIRRAMGNLMTLQLP